MSFYDAPLVVELEVESNVVEVEFEVENDILEIEFDIEQSIIVNNIGGNPYEGPYVVTPLMNNEVVLETTGKTMGDDVTVTKVPYFETSNEAGGYTVYIGEYDG